ncbi:MAG: hypothetical protein B9S35_02880 [Opitutia bacterium Tous-C5TDCM]|nr:MAG: hypothetical protein B9S35_02880 [Opitutae bacterium Tous-C5TDCM]
MRKQIEAVHGQTQLREKRSRLRIGRAAFHPPLRAPKALGQRAVLIDVAQAAQKAADFLRRAPRLSHLAQSIRGRNRAGLRGGEHAALKRPALPRPIRINPARAIRAQRRARLTKERHGHPPARDRHRQTERTQVLRIVARPELDVVKKGAVAAQAASKAEVFAGVHAPPSRRRPPKRKPPVKKQPRPLVRELEPESPEFSPTPDLQNPTQARPKNEAGRDLQPALRAHASRPRPPLPHPRRPAVQLRNRFPPRARALRTRPQSRQEHRCRHRHYEIVQRLPSFAEKCRADLRSSLTGRTGGGLREPGRPTP